MTTSTHSRFAADVRAICVLAAPLIGNNLSVIGMQFADTVMAGQLGARDLAALAVGVGFYHLFLLVGLGMLMAVSPNVAHAYGANDTRGVARYCRQAWWVGVGAGRPVGATRSAGGASRRVVPAGRTSRATS